MKLRHAIIIATALAFTAPAHAQFDFIKEWFISQGIQIGIAGPIAYTPQCTPTISPDKTCALHMTPRYRPLYEFEEEWTIANLEGMEIHLKNIPLSDGPPSSVRANSLCFNELSDVYDPVTGEPVIKLPGWGVTKFLGEDGGQVRLIVTVISRGSWLPIFANGQFLECEHQDNTPPFSHAITSGFAGSFTRVIP